MSWAEFPCYVWRGRKRTEPEDDKGYDLYHNLFHYFIKSDSGVYSAGSLLYCSVDLLNFYNMLIVGADIQMDLEA